MFLAFKVRIRQCPVIKIMNDNQAYSIDYSMVWNIVNNSGVLLNVSKTHNPLDHKPIGPLQSKEYYADFSFLPGGKYWLLMDNYISVDDPIKTKVEKKLWSNSRSLPLSQILFIHRRLKP